MKPDGHFFFVNRAWKETLGYKDEDIPLITLSDIIHPDWRKHCEALFQEVLKGIELHNVEAVFVSRDGRHIPVEGNVNLRIENGQPAGTRGIFRDITERKRAEENLFKMNKLLEHQATRDPLTGLFNRIKFGDNLQRETEKSRRYRSPLTLIMFDIDNFKTINDTFGHLAGDCLLQEIAQLVSKNIRQFEVFARWGGDEFLILSPNIEPNHAVKIAEKLRTLIERHSFSCSARITCSFGLTQFVPEDSMESLTARADKALYRAKQRGRNQVVCL